MKIPVGSYLNTSHHKLNLCFEELLYLRNYCRKKELNMCFEIGGYESGSDIQESKYFEADAFEIPFIESRFALEKVLLSFRKAFLNENKELYQHKLFINIWTKEGIEVLKSLTDSNINELDNLNDPENIIFSYDRVQIARNSNPNIQNNHSSGKFRIKINEIIEESIKVISGLGYSSCIDLEMAQNSINDHCNIINNARYLKFGRFIIDNICEYDSNLTQIIKYLKREEEEISQILIEQAQNRINYLSLEQDSSLSNRGNKE